MTEEMFFIEKGNLNAAREMAEQSKFRGQRVRVTKGRKVPIGTEGIVFWIKRYDYSKYGDAWGIYSSTRIGIQCDDGSRQFTDLRNVVLIQQEEF